MPGSLPDVDTLRAMAEQDPEGLEALRQRLTADVIAQARPSNQGRLRGLQAQIDMHRQAAQNPVDACLRISDMMQNAFGELHASMQALEARMPPDTDSELLGIAHEVKALRFKTASMLATPKATQQTTKKLSPNSRKQRSPQESTNTSKTIQHSGRSAIEKQRIRNGQAFATEIPSATIIPFKQRKDDPTTE